MARATAFSESMPFTRSLVLFCVLLFFSAAISVGNGALGEHVLSAAGGEHGALRTGSAQGEQLRRNTDGVEAGLCAKSIFDTRIPRALLVPDELEHRLTGQPEPRHPDPSICSSYANRASCCTKQVLEDYRDWATAVDQLYDFILYVEKRIERDPGSFLDEVLAALHAKLPNVDWGKARDDDLGRLIANLAKAMVPSMKKLWVTSVTYQEGLLCSACEPDFARFVEPGVGVRLHGEAAADVAEAFVLVLDAFDNFVSKTEETALIEKVVRNICSRFTDDKTTCTKTQTYAKLALQFITASALRKMVCNAGSRGTIDAKNQDCKNFTMNHVLRGLIIDASPIIDNVFNYADSVCPKGVGIDCSVILRTKDNLMPALGFTFDSRPLARNIYALNGFDTKRAACKSNLSKYACGGQGTQSILYGGESYSAAPKPVGVFITLVLSVIFAAFFSLCRCIFTRFSQGFYTRVNVDVNQSGGFS